MLYCRGEENVKERMKREIAAQKKLVAIDKNIGTQQSMRSSEPPVETTQNSDNSGNCTAKYFVVKNTTFEMTNLPHFTTYTIHVQACREEEVNDTRKVCSTASIFTARTLKAGKWYYELF